MREVDSYRVRLSIQAHTRWRQSEGRIPETWRMEGACEIVEASCDRVPTDSPLENQGRQKREVRERGMLCSECLAVGKLAIDSTSFWLHVE